MVWQIQASYEGRYSPGVRAENEGPEFNAQRGGQSFFDGVVWPLKEGRALEHPERMPTIGFIPKPRKRFYAVMRMFDQLGVTEELMDFIEEWEPGVHEFYPVRLVAKKTGEEVSITYHVLNICTRLKSVVLDEKSIIIEKIGGPSDPWVTWRPRSRNSPPPVFQKDVVRGHHLWRDDGALGWIYASDEFVEALQERNFKGWDTYHRYDEV